MEMTIAPADPGCPTCKGTGYIPLYPGERPSPFGQRPVCSCRSMDNKVKVQDQCAHDFVCRKCARTLAEHQATLTKAPCVKPKKGRKQKVK